MVLLDPPQDSGLLHNLASLEAIVKTLPPLSPFAFLTLEHSLSPNQRAGVDRDELNSPRRDRQAALQLARILTDTAAQQTS